MVVLAGVCTAQESAKDEALPKNFKELAQRIALKRESIVSYQVYIKETKQIDKGSGLSEIKDENTSEYYFEMSRVEDHVVRAVKTHKKDWVIFGKSDSIHFGGTAQAGILVSSDLELPDPYFFDPLIMGLNFCNMGYTYSPFEDALLGLSKLDIDSVTKKPIGTITRTEDGEIQYAHVGTGSVLRVDPDRGYWTVEYEIKRNHPLLAKVKRDRYEMSLWQNIEKVNNVYVPVYCSMSCLSDGNFGRELKTYALDWKTVNTVIKTGEESVDAICEQLKTRRRTAE